MASASGAYEKNLKDGEILFKEGDKGEEMYLIRSGKIEISNAAGGVKKVLAVLGEGSFIGEMAVVDDAPRSATATAAGEVSLLILDRSAFKEQIQSNPMIEYLITSLIKRLRETNEQVKILLQKDDTCRIAACILSLGREKGQPDGAGVMVRGHYDYDVLAVNSGVGKPKASEILDKMVKQSLIVLTPDGLKVPSIADLEEYWKFATLQEKFKGMG